MNKKFLSAALAALLVASMGAFAASADEVETAASGASGTLKFDAGNWNSDRICFYIWDATESPAKFATKDGWVDTQTWGSKKISSTRGEDGLFESYEFEIPEGHEVYVIFYDLNNGYQTYDYLLTPDVFGKTAVKSDETLLAPQDGRRAPEYVDFVGSAAADKKDTKDEPASKPAVTDRSNDSVNGDTSSKNAAAGSNNDSSKTSSAASNTSSNNVTSPKTGTSSMGLLALTFAAAAGVAALISGKRKDDK